MAVMIWDSTSVKVAQKKSLGKYSLGNKIGSVLFIH